MLYNYINFLVNKICRKDSERPELDGVLVAPDKTVATDSFRLIEISTPNEGLKIEDYPKTLLGERTIRMKKPFIIPSENARHFADRLSKISGEKEFCLPKIFNHVVVSDEDDKQVYFITLEGPALVYKIKTKYPDYEKVFPKGKPITKIIINPLYLRQILEIIEKIPYCPADGIEISFYGKNKPLLLIADSGTQKARALIMPIDTAFSNSLPKNKIKTKTLKRKKD